MTTNEDEYQKSVKKKFKILVEWLKHGDRGNKKIGAQSSQSITIRVHAYWQRRHTSLLKSVIFTNFQTLMTLTLDQVIRHTIV